MLLPTRSNDGITNRHGVLIIRLRRLPPTPRVFDGGLYLSPPVEVGKHEPIREFPCPARLTVPMIQHAGPACEPLVQVGQAVAEGQLIGRALRPGAVPVHSPRTGRVVALSRARTAWSPDVPAVTIETGPAEEYTLTPALESSMGSSPDFSSRPGLERLAELADRAGILVGREPAIGLGDQLRHAADAGIQDFIINGLARDPLLENRSVCMAQDLESVVRAGLWVRQALGSERACLVVDRTDRRLLMRARKATAHTPFRIVQLGNKYPQAAPVLLTWCITGRETPCGKTTEDVHALVMEPEALSSLANAVLNGKTITDSVVVVTGPGVRQPGEYRIPVGSSFADVLNHVGVVGTTVRLVDGPPMTGRAIECLDAVVTRRTTAILVMNRDHDRVPDPGLCLRCGWCQDDCPVGLDPMALLDCDERGDWTAAASLHPHACLGCGLCSCICPAELPLSESISRLKERVPLDAL